MHLMLPSRFDWQIMEHWQIMEYDWDCRASHWWQNYCKTGCSLVSGGRWALSRATSTATGRHESGRAGLPGSGRRCCPSFLHQSQALTLTLLAQGFFPARDLLHPVDGMKRREAGLSTQRAAAGTTLLRACQHHWEEGINHCAVWHGGCREASTKSWDTWSPPGLHVQRFGLNPLQTLSVQAPEPHIHLHPSSPRCTGSPQSLLALALPSPLLSAATSSKTGTPQPAPVPSAPVHRASCQRRFWHLRIEKGEKGAAGETCRK